MITNDTRDLVANNGCKDRTTVRLPEAPVISIRPSTLWSVPQLPLIWARRELFYFLVWRDLKVRYKQTALGAAWVLLQPLLLMLMFSLFFGRWQSLMSASVPYPVFTLAGLLPWTFFAGAVTNSGNSLIGNASVITKVYFPRLLIPAAAVAATLVDLTITCALLAGLMLYYGTGLHSTFLVIPFLIALLTLLALAIGTWIAAVNVRYRDARYALPFLMQVWLFASPVIYSVPRGWRSLLMLNPLTGIIEGFRSAVFGWPFDWPALASAAAITFVCLCYSAVSFGRMERDVADII